MTLELGHIQVQDIRSSSPFCHPILKRSAETESIKTTFPRFFCAHSNPPQPRIYKAFAPYPLKLPILKSESNSQKPPAFKTHKSRKIRRILEKSQKNLTSGNSSCLKCKLYSSYCVAVFIDTSRQCYPHYAQERRLFGNLSMPY